MIRDVHPASGIRIFFTHLGSRIKKARDTVPGSVNSVFIDQYGICLVWFCVCVLLPEPGEDGSVRLPGQPVPANYLNQGQYVGAGTFYTTAQHQKTQVYSTPGKESIGVN